MDIEPTFLAYVAGIMDGEGCFRIERKKPNGAHRSVKYTIMITVQMSEKPVIDAIAARLRATIERRDHERWVYKKNPPRRPSYRFQLHAKRAADFIRLILPYLIGKKEQASLCLEFYDQIGSQQQRKRKFTEGELAIRADYHDRVAALKRPGLTLGSGLSQRDFP